METIDATVAMTCGIYPSTLPIKLPSDTPQAVQSGHLICRNMASHSLIMKFMKEEGCMFWWALAVASAAAAVLPETVCVCAPADAAAAASVSGAEAKSISTWFEPAALGV